MENFENLSEQQQQIVSSFPFPPYFYKYYRWNNDKNISLNEKIEKIEKEIQLVEGDINQLKGIINNTNNNELIVIEPPEPPKPIEGTYMMFGKKYTVNNKNIFIINKLIL